MKENIYNGKNTVFLHFFIMMYFNVYKVVVQSKGVFRGGLEYLGHRCFRYFIYYPEHIILSIYEQDL